MRIEKTTMTFSISERILSQHVVFTYVLQHSSTVQPVQRISKGFLQKYRPWQDSNQARATASTPTRAMAPSTSELSYRTDVQLPSLICDPTIVKDLKKTPATVSLCDLQQLQKYFLSNHVL
jgi:hypothetical protein